MKHVFNRLFSKFKFTVKMIKTFSNDFKTFEEEKNIKKNEKRCKNV